MYRNKGIQRLSILIGILALTILSCQGVGGFNPFATATLTPTATFTLSPSPTPSSTPTLTPTLPPTATPVPTGMKIEQQSDNSTLLTDYDNKYQLVLSDEWIILPFDKGNLTSALETISKDNPDLAKVAEAFKNLDSSVFRIVALNKNTKFISNNAAPNLNITALDNNLLASMPLSFVTGAMEDSLQQSGAKVLTQGVNTIENQQGVEIEFIDVEQTLQGTKIHQRVMVFQSNKKLILITLTTLKQFSKDVFPLGDEIGRSIKLIK